MSFNVHALAASVVRDAPTPDPDDMVREFIMQLQPENYVEALTVMARGYIRNIILSQRSNLNGGQPGVGSRKVAAAREAWKRLLDTPEFIPSMGQWLFLRDATAEQVLEMAGMRRQKAAELSKVADRYHELSATMNNAGVARVGDLPDDTLARLLQPAAELKAVRTA